MSKGRRVSICVPTYNGEQYLAACLDSICSQTYDDFEVLVVDDCSSDRSLEIANNYASRDDRFRVFSNEHNLGLVGNWNKCIQLAGGEWIKFVFQDDLIAPQCIERLFKVADPEVGFVFCRRDFIFEEGTPQKTQQGYHRNKKKVEKNFPDAGKFSGEYCAKVILKKIGTNFLGDPTAVMLHNSIFRKFGEFNPHLIVACDTEYWMRVSVNTGVIHMPETLATFRVHGKTTTALSRASRKYRTRYLDNMILYHELAYNPFYGPLLRLAKQQKPAISFQNEFKKRASWTYALARKAAKGNGSKDNGSKDSSMLEEWNAVSNYYQRFSQIRWRYEVSQLWQKLSGKKRMSE